MCGNQQSDFRSKLNSIEEAIEDIRLGKVIIVVDDEDRENEGDFLAASEKATPEMINFFAKEGRGLICVAITEERCNQLDLNLMVGKNTSPNETAFTVSVDPIGFGCTTGISAYDRSVCVKLLADPQTRPEQLGRPGHIFPLKAKSRGVLRRAGHTEAAVDLARLAGLEPSGILVEIMNDDGTMARLPELVKIAKKHHLKIITIADLIAYRNKRESLIKRGVEAFLPTKYGNFKIVPYRQKSNGKEHLALVKGEWTKDDAILVRMHSSCITGDILGSQRCECGDQLHKSMELVEKEGKGVIIYLDQEGRGIGLMNKIEAYKLQEDGMDTVQANVHLGFAADERDYGVGAQILCDLGVSKMRLLTNNPVKRVGLEGYGLTVVENVAIEVEPNQHNLFYMKTKRDQMGHKLQSLTYDEE